GVFSATWLNHPTSQMIYRYEGPGAVPDWRDFARKCACGIAESPKLSEGWPLGMPLAPSPGMQHYGRALGFLLVMGFVAAPGVASARRDSGKKVVLMGVAGAPQVEKDLARLLRVDHRLIGQKEYIRVATQIGATGTDPESVSRVAARLGAAAIVAGKV